ncbi:MAG: hypothetical protein VB112_02825 [Oscillospiraceae bacterium]|nr:hypothetical protein [Oscillospiraceae bacterium]
MPDRFSLIFTSVFTGAACAALRALQSVYGFDGAGLPAVSPFGPASAACAAASAAALLALSRRVKPATGFFSPMSRPWVIVSALGSLCLALSGIGYMFSSLGGAVSAAEFLLGAFAVFAAVLSPLARRTNHDGTPARGRLLFALIPTCFCVAWIVVFYRDHAADPLLWHYWCPLLAIAALTISFYYSAGLYCGRMFFRRAAFFSALAVMLSISALPGNGVTPVFFCIAGCALMRLAELRMLLATENSLSYTQG